MVGVRRNGKEELETGTALSRSFSVMSGTMGRWLEGNVDGGKIGILANIY